MYNNAWTAIHLYLCKPVPYCSNIDHNYSTHTVCISVPIVNQIFIVYIFCTILDDFWWEAEVGR